MRGPTFRLRRRALRDAHGQARLREQQRPRHHGSNPVARSGAGGADAVDCAGAARPDHRPLPVEGPGRSLVVDAGRALRAARHPRGTAAGGEKTQLLRAARYRAVAGAATLALALMGVAAWQFWPRQPARVDQPLIRFPVYAPESATWAASDGPGLFRLTAAASPSPRRFPTGGLLLWVRLQEALSAQPLSGTEAASDPFWSPDSRFIGFFADGHLKAIDVSGGSPTVLCPAPYGGGGPGTPAASSSSRAPRAMRSTRCRRRAEYRSK